MSLFKRKETTTTIEGTLAKVLTVWAPVAAGKTVLSMALALRASQVRKTVLVDFDVFTPHRLIKKPGLGLEKVSRDLNLKDFNAEEWLKKLPTINKLTIVPGFLEDILSSEQVSRKDYRFLIRLLMRKFDVVIIDTNRAVNNDATLTALDASVKVLVPVFDAEDNLWHTGKYLKFLNSQLGYDLKKFTVVINQRHQSQIVPEVLKEIIPDVNVSEIVIPYVPSWDNISFTKLPPIAKDIDALLYNLMVISEAEEERRGAVGNG
ncbi:MAG: ParA family protein [Thermoanaerobacteraceae bacterium]|nr:ParA family protein [Thermoanaerobacteraceae bacterium]